MKTFQHFCLFLLLMFISDQAFCQSVSYSVRPGTSEWESFGSYDEMVKACNIPAEQIALLSTEDLLSLCLMHPLRINIFLYSSPQESLERMISTFNVFSEFMKRTDAKESLGREIKKTTGESAVLSDPVKRTILGALSFRINEATEKRAQNSYVVRTPNGSIVGDTGVNPEQRTSAEIQQITAEFAAAYPKATVISPATSTYNCHAYAWHMSEGGAAVWMGFTTNPTSIYWTDGSYNSTSCRGKGLKVSYENDNHSAITTDIAGIFISKWGTGPLMKHSMDYCPYNSSALKYYIRNLPSQDYITGVYIQNTVSNKLNTVNMVRGNSPITIKVDYPNAYKIEWQLVSGQPNVAFGAESNDGKTAGLSLNGSNSASLKAIAHTPCGKIETAFYFVRTY